MAAVVCKYVLKFLPFSIYSAENGVSNFVPHLVTDQDDYVDIDFDYKDLYEEEDRNYYIPWDDIFYTEKEYSGMYHHSASWLDKITCSPWVEPAGSVISFLLQ